MMRGHWLPLAVVLLVVGALYAPVSQAYFVGYDDFYVVHRTAFEDTPHPAHIFTTSHFTSAKYRPGERVLDYVAYHLGHGRPLAFRLRNIACLMGGSVMLYILGMSLFASRAIAFSAALLFGLNPLPNQSVLAASWTNSAAALFLLASFVLLMQGARSTRGLGWLAGSLLCLSISLSIYEAGIMMIVVWVIFLLIEQPSWRFVTAWAIGLGLVLGLFFLARALVVQAPPQHGSISTISRNLVFFGGALLASPADSILLHDIFDTPLPSDISLHDASILIPLGTGLATIICITFLLWRRIRTTQGFSEPLPGVRLFLLAASIPLWLVPFLLFTPHPSETYLYLPTASACLFLAAFLHCTLRSRNTFTGVIVFLALLFGVATYNRSRHVIASAEIAQRIVLGFPLNQWRRGTWDIRVAEADPPLTRYGLYSFHGLSTIDPGDPTIPATEYALQLATGNPDLSVRVVSANEMAGTPCLEPRMCYWVYADGRVARTPAAPPQNP
jgi:hypothetical protein